ncbi:hypothetical protein GCM10010199_10590 [Dactylosporangium roseum]
MRGMLGEAEVRDKGSRIARAVGRREHRAGQGRPSWGDVPPVGRAVTVATRSVAGWMASLRSIRDNGSRRFHAYLMRRVRKYCR